MSSGASVLIAEDDFNFRDTLEDALLEDGHNVVRARNGAEALAAVEKLPRPSLVLLDLHMPVMDGIAFLRELRKRDHPEDFEVIVMSAVVDPDEWASKLPGITRILRKPFEIEEVQALVAEFAERRPPRLPGQQPTTH